jgi:hypothetical protein
MLQIDKGQLAANPLSKTGITKTSPNAIRKLLQINRPDTITALMHECVLVPEGRTEFDLLRLLAMALELHDKELLPDRSLFGTLVGIVPTHDAAVKATFEALRCVHPNVVPLIDGDAAGNGYSRLSNQWNKFAGRAGVQWSRNIHRDSGISYAVAAKRDVAEVALDSGNSLAVIMSNYLKAGFGRMLLFPVTPFTG